MRVWVLILMMVLLPLRGWAGSAMAFDHAMAVAPVSQGSHTPLAPCHGAAAAAESDAAGHGHTAAPPGDLSGPGSHIAATTCGLCDVCHSPLMMSACGASAGPRPIAQAHAATPEHFASANARLHLKPPRT